MWHVWWFGLLKLKTCRLCAVCEVCFSCQLLWSILGVSICEGLHSHAAHCLYLSCILLCLCLTASVKNAQILSGQGMKIAMCIYRSLFVVLFTLAHLRIAGGLLVQALDCRSKGPRFQEYIVQVWRMPKYWVDIRIAMCIYRSLFVVLFTLVHLRVAGGLLVQALDCRSKGQGFQSHLQQRFISLLAQPHLINWVEGFPSRSSERKLSLWSRGTP